VLLCACMVERSRRRPRNRATCVFIMYIYKEKDINNLCIAQY
jgi:hypothetical protein